MARAGGAGAPADRCPFVPGAAPVARRAAPRGGGGARRPRGGRVSERGSAFGAFLFGLGIGAALGFLFAPDAGEASRAKLSRPLRDLGGPAVEEVGELAELEGGEDDADAAPPPPPAP